MVKFASRAVIFAFLHFFVLKAQCGPTPNAEAGPEVRTEAGIVRGTVNATVGDGRPYFAFRGIPFAEPPVGNLRFEPPVPKTPWEGTLDATRDGSMCVQGLTEGSEDCLFINVYTPQKDVPILPVMVFVYGGGFEGGDSNYSSYGPDYFLDKNVTVVTFNYRLGILGFLSTGDLVVPGNMGLKDQVLALKWVQENIANFGGDPGNVTLFGESAGSASVAYHVHSKLSAGLFHKAIMESGVSFSQWAYSRHINRVAMMVAQNVGVNITTSQQLADGLKQIAVEKLQSAAVTNEVENYIIDDPREGFAYAPVIEPEHPGAFLTEDSHVLMARGDFNRVPCIIGFNSLEGTFNFPEIFRTYLLKYDTFDYFIPPASMNANISDLGGIADIIKQHYFGKIPIHDSNQTLMAFVSDDEFVRPIREYALLLSRHAPTYLYRFSYLGRLAGWGPGNERPGDGVAHGEELAYMWRTYVDAGVSDMVTRIRMVSMWTNFAKTGNPTPSKDFMLENVIWPVTDEQHTYLDIGNDLVVADSPQKEDMELWDELFETYGNPPYITY